MNVDLSGCKNLDAIYHRGLSTIDIRTLQRSGRLPLVLLRGVGLPEALIDYLPSLLGQAKTIDFYSCFISYRATLTRVLRAGCTGRLEGRSDTEQRQHGQ